MTIDKLKIGGRYRFVVPITTTMSGWTEADVGELLVRSGGVFVSQEHRRHVPIRDFLLLAEPVEVSDE